MRLRYNSICYIKKFTIVVFFYLFSSLPQTPPSISNIPVVDNYDMNDQDLIKTEIFCLHLQVPLVGLVPGHHLVLR